MSRKTNETNALLRAILAEATTIAAELRYAREDRAGQEVHQLLAAKVSGLLDGQITTPRY